MHDSDSAAMAMLYLNSMRNGVDGIYVANGDKVENAYNDFELKSSRNRTSKIRRTGNKKRFRLWRWWV